MRELLRKYPNYEHEPEPEARDCGHDGAQKQLQDVAGRVDVLHTYIVLRILPIVTDNFCS